MIRRATPPGSAPGVIVIDPESMKPELRMIAYGPEGIQETEVANPADVAPHLATWPVTWLDMAGLGDADVLHAVRDLFEIHPLDLEDVVQVGQRPKADVKERYVFIVLQMPMAYESHVDFEQVSLFFGEHFVLSVQERPGDCFEPVRERVRGGRPKIRGGGPDYLAYALLDAVVDSYFPIAETYADRLTRLEEEVLASADSQELGEIHGIKSDLFALRRGIWPLRDILTGLLREPGPLFRRETLIYLRDVYDHVSHLIDLIESYRDAATNLTELHLSMVSHKMNEVMKVLTIIATIFIPLTFIAGIYGMNFQHMPELAWEWGYAAVVAVMAAITILLLVYFRRRDWI